MPEALADDLGMDAGLQPQRRERVTQLVQMIGLPAVTRRRLAEAGSEEVDRRAAAAQRRSTE